MPLAGAALRHLPRNGQRAPSPVAGGGSPADVVAPRRAAESGSQNGPYKKSLIDGAAASA